MLSIIATVYAVKCNYIRLMVQRTCSSSEILGKYGLVWKGSL